MSNRKDRSLANETIDTIIVNYENFDLLTIKSLTVIPFNKMVSLLDLNFDVLEKICQLLPLEDFINFRITCRQVNNWARNVHYFQEVPLIGKRLFKRGLSFYDFTWPIHHLEAEVINEVATEGKKGTTLYPNRKIKYNPTDKSDNPQNEELKVQWQEFLETILSNFSFRYLVIEEKERYLPEIYITTLKDRGIEVEIVNNYRVWKIRQDSSKIDYEGARVYELIYDEKGVIYDPLPYFEVYSRPVTQPAERSRQIRFFSHTVMNKETLKTKIDKEIKKAQFKEQEKEWKEVRRNLNHKHFKPPKKSVKQFGKRKFKRSWR